MTVITTRIALLPDAPQIHDLISRYSGDGTLLPRSLAEICENVRDFIVAEIDSPGQERGNLSGEHGEREGGTRAALPSGGKATTESGNPPKVGGRGSTRRRKPEGTPAPIIGCAALHIYGLNLAEIRSVAVHPLYTGHNCGSLLVEELKRHARHHRIGRVFLFTRTPDFFNRMGFAQVPHGLLPEKVHRDCYACPRRLCCDEIAMLHGGVSAEEALQARGLDEIIAARNRQAYGSN